MLFNLHHTNPVELERFEHKVAHIKEKAAGDGCVVELTEKKERRTLSQNKYLHLILGHFALEYGETMEYVKRRYFKELCSPDLFVFYKNDRYMGMTQELRSSRDVDTAEMTLAIERFRHWSSKECGIYLPTAEEHAFLRQIEVDMDRNKEWL